MQRLLKTFTVALFLIVFSGAAFGASLGLDVDSIYFNADEKVDIVGAGTSRIADGKLDASFSLAVSGAQAITEISLRNETTGKVWSTSPSNNVGLLTVKNSGGNILNTSGRLPVTPVLMGADFKLYINDAEGSIPNDSDFTVIVRLIDNQEVTGKTSVKGFKTATPVATSPNSSEGIYAFEINGTSQHDYAGTSEKVGADGRNDQQFTLSLNFRDEAVRAVHISARTYSQNAQWDTVAGNNIPIVTVIDSGNNILNRTDGTVAFYVRGLQKYTLLTQDRDGIMGDQSVKARITVSLADGRVFEKDAVMSGNTTAFKETLSVEYKGNDNYDFTGQNERMESNLNPDRLIRAVINASGTITGVRVRSATSGKVWDTIAGNSNPLVVLVSGPKLNHSDGTVSIPVNGEKALNLWFDEEDNRNIGPYQVTFVMSNGQVLEARTGNTPAAQSAPAANVTKADRSVVFSSARPALVNLDHVGKNKKRAANGYKDTALNIKITGKGNVKSILITEDNSGRGWDGKGWDTLKENNGRWLLGVREGNRILNHNNGEVRIPVNGTKNYQLLMQDNGNLRKRNGVLHVSVEWADGQVSESYLKW
ncbi:MAG: hypothetical protein U2P59_06595 [Synergistota bacterium]|nr:hypothetical protein [Synergistota bacterium]